MEVDELSIKPPEIIREELTEDEQNALLDKFQKVYLAIDKYVEIVTNDLSKIVQTGQNVYIKMDRVLDAQLSDAKKTIEQLKKEEEENNPNSSCLSERKAFYLKHFMNAHARLAEKNGGY
jgi:hypothetical protein